MIVVIVYGVLTALLLPVVWAARAVGERGTVPEERWFLRRGRRWRLTAEFVASAALGVGSLGLVWQLEWARVVYILAVGMVGHSLLRAPDEVGSRLRRGTIVLVAALLAGAIVSLMRLGVRGG